VNSANMMTGWEVERAVVAVGRSCVEGGRLG
jgi:hypothetical protein